MASGKSIGKTEGQSKQVMVPPSPHTGHPIQGRTAHGSGNTKAK